MGPIPTLHHVETTLGRYVSAINARVAVERARRVLGEPTRIAPHEWDGFLAALFSSARMFLPEARLEAFKQDLVAPAATSSALPAPRDLAVKNEDDVRVARLVAREMCQALDAPAYVVQRVATSVSELTRNIISYTPGGTLRLEPLAGEPPRIRLVATDTGAGISNLTEIFSGQYQSKTGLGRGLLGVKKLMATFDIQTGPAGTRITAEAVLK